MSNPPPVRPWFRLTSIRPVPTPASASASAPAPAPEPRTSLPLPTFRTSSAPTSPQIHPTQQQTQPQDKTTQQQPPSPPPRRIVSTSLPSSPLRKAPPLSSSSPPRNPAPPQRSSSPEKKNSPITTRVLPSPTPHQSPKTIRQSDLSPMHSPKSKLSSARPPSPLTLPPSQLKTEEPNVPVEAESKAVLVQKTVDKPKTLHNNGSGEHHHRETRNHGNPHHGKHLTRREGEDKERTKVSDSEDSGMRVITIAGENRGAYMELVQSPKKKEPHYLHKKGNEHVKDVGGGSESSGAEEGNMKKKDKNQKGRMGSSSSFPMTAYMNSNVQCVNNSLLYHASCSHHDPGVRLSLTKKPLGEGYYLKEHVDGNKNK